jgi:hypothetical protein
MSSIGDKVAHVKKSRQVRLHACHWPGCGKQVPPALWGCRAHWFALPAGLRAKIWRTYRIGQETDGRPSVQYIAVAHEVQRWITEHLARTGQA